MRHRNFMNCLYSFIRIGIFSEADTVLQMSRCSFDLHFGDIIGTIAVGASIVMLHPDGTIDSEYIVNTMKKKEISYLLSVPTILNALLEFSLQREDQVTMRTLRSLCSIGESST